ncbi:hypothetical protein SARC_08639 [Sphaeroforma arctica JP610]|uniref:PNPLA domain-containing protein n=1 Tax=Sphaeroforma arctica JP610 TaxID=667725 RepID=A0A0L0FQH2_9EUKA|nr:hypothetical protein SARC_08639 [Sphaeroforma arctica JP610]KNC78949.1 hypothetical protein SARC_08639 [Sphaeroforma arctica JP610]|eukprot:XP_014152851.1 hypothetical protein SARC_08639 [Sphaeroforma arctica JP610]
MVSESPVMFTDIHQQDDYNLSGKKNSARAMPQVVPGQRVKKRTDANLCRKHSLVQNKAPLTFSFSACGWLKLYHFGAVQALIEYGLNKNGARFAGASAGALAGVCLVIGSDMQYVKEVCMENLDEVRANPFNGLCIRYYLNRAIDKVVGEERYLKHKEALDAHAESAVTILPGCHGTRYSETRDYDHFKKVLLASCCAPPIAGFPFMLDGKLVIDGGIADFQPLVDDNSITINPLYFHNADIRPSQYVPVWWAAFPPTKEEYDRLFTLGYTDTIAWMNANGHKAPSGYVTPEWAVWEETSELSTIDVGEKLAPKVKAVETHRMDMYQDRIHKVIHKVEQLIGGCTRDNETIHMLDEQVQTAITHERHRHLHRTNQVHYHPGRGQVVKPCVTYLDKAIMYFSDAVDFLMLSFMYMWVKPIACILLYAELFLLAGGSFLYLVLMTLLIGIVDSKRRKRAFNRLADDLYSLSSVGTLAEAVVSPTTDVDRSLFKHSLVIRYMF